MNLCPYLIRLSLIALLCGLSVSTANCDDIVLDENPLADVEQSRQARVQPLRTPWAFIAISSHTVNPGHIRTELFREGTIWLEREVQRLYEIGFRVVLLHRPFGEPDPGDLMDYDALLQLRDTPQAGPIVRGMGKVFDRMLQRHDDLHLVVYVGSMNADSIGPVFDESPDQWLARAALAIWPVLESTSPRLHLAIDHSSAFELDSPEYLWIQLADRMLAQRGASLWIEAFPRFAHLASFPAFGTQKAWENGVLAGRARPSRIANTLFFFDAGLPPNEWIRDVQTLGAIPAVRHNLEDPSGTTPKSLLRDLGVIPSNAAFD